MTTVNVSAAVAADVLNAIKNALDIGGAGTPAALDLYTGTRPASPETAITSQVLLGTLVCSYPVGSVSGRSLVFSAITTDSSADASGTVTWGRFRVGNEACIDVDASLTGGSGFLQFNNTNIAAGGPIVASSCVISV